MMATGNSNSKSYIMEIGTALNEDNTRFMHSTRAFHSNPLSERERLYTAVYESHICVNRDRPKAMQNRA